ncbi:MAG: hypothetical protein H6814_08600 [Phycisphaeraceae bacterium]|nr:hypothetical protein [Phycisphaeraceae bacterium]
MTTTTATDRRCAPRNRTLALTILAGAAASLAWAGAAWGADLPLTDITLYRSGVGSFSHNGKVTGSETVELDFGVDRINDILKSMVCLDYSGGEIGGVVYEPRRSVDARLADFEIDPRTTTSMETLLNALKGEPIEVEMADGSVSGTVIGVERIPFPNLTRVVLMTPTGVRATDLSQVRSMSILNEKLAAELEKGLAAIAEHRSDRRTSIDVNFNGKGERRVSVVYTHSAPVWKVSYRLVLPQSPGDEPYLQGWAIVENDTDADWDGVKLSLASGRPVSFVMDLQTPLNLQRPYVAVPVLAGLGPVVYESVMPGSELAQMGTISSNGPSIAMAARRDGRSMAEESDAFAYGAASAPKQAMLGDIPILEGMTHSSATAGEAGEQFLYTIDAPVSIDKGKSSMLPILGQDIEGRRLTIYSPDTGVDRPMRGVELTNDTGLHLPPGPVAVYDADAYAGDAQIRHTSRDQKRLLSYAVDLDVDVNPVHDSLSRVTKLKIVDGMVIETSERTDRQTYTAVNRDTKRPRTVMIERPLMTGWTLSSKIKPSELTKNAERYLVDLKPGESGELVVEHSRTDSTRLAVLGYDLTRLLSYQTNGAASPQVVAAIRKAADMQGRINGLSSRMNQIDREQSEIAQDQDRIRRNMGTVQRGTDLHTRYIQKLDEQEDRIETLLSQREDLLAERDTAQAELDGYLRGLNVG